MIGGRTEEKKGLSLEVRILLVNFFILAIVIAGAVSKAVAAAGAILVLLYLLAKAVKHPGEAVFLAFGVKLTFDALWDVSFFTVPLAGTVGPLDLFVLVILVLAFLGPPGERKWAGRLYALPTAYLLWTVTAAAANGFTPGPEVILRQAGMLFGIIVGVKYMRKREDLEKMILVVFLSTLVPVLASTVDATLGPTGLSIFHYKTSSIRGVRLSGLYYDSATTGMMAILSVFTNLYLLGRGLVPQKIRKYQALLIPLAFVVILSGGTRSVTMVTLLGMAVLMTRNRRTVLYIIPFLMICGYFAQPYISNMMSRTEYETKEPIHIGSVLEDESYRGLFTGRVSLWQDIWKEFRGGSDLQVLFGHGRTSNAHSAYFFLLLQVGWLGLAFFIHMHLVLFKGVWLSGADPPFRNFALVCHLGYLLLGFSMATVMYTSFQWIIFLFVAAVTTGFGPSEEEAKAAMAEAARRGFFLPDEDGADSGEGTEFPEPALSPHAAGRKEARRPATSFHEPISEHAPAAGGAAGGGEPPLRTRPEAFEFFAASSRWFALAAVPALLIAGLWLYGQRSAARRSEERTARMETLLPTVAVPEPDRPAPPPPEPAPVMVDEDIPPAAPPPDRTGREPEIAVPSVEVPPPKKPPMDFGDVPPEEKSTAAPERFAEPEPAPPPPFDAAAALAAASVLAEEGSVAAAQEAYLEIVERDPRVHEAYMALGELALDRGDYQGATKYFRLAEAFIRSGE